MNKMKYLVFTALVFLSACEIVKVVEPPAVEDFPPSKVETVGFRLVSSAVLSPTISLRASWAKPVADGRGDPEYYLHTMTANKALTSGTLPVRKRVNGLADTITIGRPAVLDTIILTSQVWSVRRGLESITPATGRVVIITSDAPPGPPDTVIVDTIIVSPVIVTPELFTVSTRDVNTSKSFNSLFIRDEKGTTTFSHSNTTYITLVKN